MRKGIFVSLFVILIISACSVPEKDIITNNDFKIDQSGNLIFRGTDLGRIRGDNGKDGLDGINGKDGKDGLNGKDGKDGLDGKDGNDGYIRINAQEPEYFEYIDLSKYNIGDLIPIEIGKIPFTWVLEESKWIKLEKVSLKLIKKYNIDESKSDLNKRVYDAFYPYLLELRVSGSTSLDMVESHNVVVIFTDANIGRGGGSEINSDGTFEIIEEFGEHNYNKLIFSKAYFEKKVIIP